MMLGSKLSAEICDAGLLCCQAGHLESNRDDFKESNVDVFYGSMMIGECAEFEMGDGEAAIMILTHSGLDGWTGDWVR